VKTPFNNLDQRHTANLTGWLLRHLDQIALDTVTLAGGDLCQYGVEPFTWDGDTIPCARVHFDLDTGIPMYRLDWVPLAKDFVPFNTQRIRVGIFDPCPCFTLMTVDYPSDRSAWVLREIVIPAELVVARTWDPCED
jgi:hypothetical protein